MVVTIIYFKSSGKFYTDDEFNYDGPWYEVGDYVRTRNATHSLPGLQSGIWDGPILVNSEEAYPVLILPR